MTLATLASCQRLRSRPGQAERRVDRPRARPPASSRGVAGRCRDTGGASIGAGTSRAAVGEPRRGAYRQPRCSPSRPIWGSPAARPVATGSDSRSGFAGPLARSAQPSPVVASPSTRGSRRPTSRDLPHVGRCSSATCARHRSSRGNGSRWDRGTCGLRRPPFLPTPRVQIAVALRGGGSATTALPVVSPDGLGLAARAQNGTPQSGNHRSSSGSIGSSEPSCAFSCSSRSVLRCLSPGAATNGYQVPRLKL